MAAHGLSTGWAVAMALLTPSDTGTDEQRPAAAYDDPDTEGRLMRRPIGVTILAAAGVLAGLAQVYAMLVYLGILKFDFIGKSVSFNEAQWGPALWALIMAAIWFWVAAGFWNLRAYAVQFGIFISLFTLIWGFFALLFGSTYEAQTIPWLLAGGIYLYLSYPGVQRAFVENERSRLTPEQRAAMDQMARANASAATAQQAPGMPAARQGTAPVVSQAASSAPATTVPDLSSQLAELAKLHEAGTLSDADYDAAKAKLLA
jgi:hypothetical protein